MIFPFPLVLDVFVLNDKTEQLKKADVEYNLQSCDTREMTFLSIDCFIEHIDVDNKKYTEVFSGGFNFIATMNYKDFKEVIEDLLK